MGSITLELGDGIQADPGYWWDDSGTWRWVDGCNHPYPDVIINFGEPFGHAHEPGMIHMLDNCPSTRIYNEKYSYNVDSLSCCHEVVLAYINCTGTYPGHSYTFRVQWKDSDDTDVFAFEWTGLSGVASHTISYIGWTCCASWPGGEWYNPQWGMSTGWPEISGTGTYSCVVTLIDELDDSIDATATKSFTVTNMYHTIIHGNIKNYIGENIKDDIGFKITGTISTPCTVSGSSSLYTRIKNEDSDYNIYVDGMEGFLDIIPYKCGYKLETFNEGPVYKENINSIDDIVLNATIHGRVTDIDDNGIINANTFTDYGNYSSKTNSDGYYALPICISGYYIPSAVKNNFNTSISSTFLQYGNHPDNPITRNFILSRQSDATGKYAHEDVLCIFNQSVIIPDDPVIGTGSLLQAMTIAPTLVKAKTQKWSSDPALSTSSGSGSGYQQNGSGGYNSNGGMGDAENWEWDQESEDPISWSYTGLCGGGTCSGTGFNPCTTHGYTDRYYEGGYYVRYVSTYLEPTRVILEIYDSGGSHYTGYLQVNDTFLFNGKHRTISDILPNVEYDCSDTETILYTITTFKWVV
jgi:hypothetical protein